MELINFLLFLFIYVPLNIIVMLVAALCFSFLNKVLGLNFPSWVVAFSAGLLVFALLWSMIETTSSMKSSNTGMYYSTTIFINIVVIILMLTFSGIGKLVFKKDPNAAAFSFGRSQKIAAVVYLVAIGSVAAIPALATGKAYLEDVTNDNYKAKIKKIIEKNDSTDFAAALEKNYKLAELRLDNYNNQSLLEWLLGQDKTALVDILLKHDKALITYSFEWDIQSAAMITVLVNNGMKPATVVEKLTYKNKAPLVKTVIETYKPTFNGEDTLIVQYITRDLLDYNQNPDLLDYLVQHGLAAGVPQTSEAISYFIKKNDFNTVKLLDEKGFKIDTANHYLMETAISNRNVDIIQFLLARQFNPNRSKNEYTYIEYAIISNAEPVIDVLLQLKPDVTTLHDTDDETAINALLLAEKHNRTAMLEKLKAYSRS